MRLLQTFAWLLLATSVDCAAPQKPLSVYVHAAEPFPSLLDATLSDLTTALEEGKLSSVNLTKSYIKRIEQVNAVLHAVTEINPDALFIAAALDEERKAGHIRGPLHGIPILLKDNIATADKMNNTAGSLLLLGAKVPRDATVTRKLREAGAIILGKANLSEWAQARGNSTSGWSPYGGQTYGAYFEQQSPSGSSSGSGVSADLGLAFAALGTETAGSIIGPAGMNNVVGIKPTRGLTSRHLVVPICDWQDTVGPLARTVKDAAVILQAIAGKDGRDNFTSAIPSDTIPNYVAACREDALRGARIGVPWNTMEISSMRPEPEILNAFHEAIAVLSAAGATIVSANFTSGTELENLTSVGIAAHADLYTAIPKYLAELSFNPHDIHTIQDVRDKMRTTPGEGYPHYDTFVFDEAADQGFNTSDPRFWSAHLEVQRVCGTEGIYGAMDEHDLDALILPTVSAPAFPGFIGSPAVSVPMGFYPEGAKVRWDRNNEIVEAAPGIPFGLSFMARRWEEEMLIGLAYAYEQRTTVRGKAPKRVVQPAAEVFGM